MSGRKLVLSSTHEFGSGETLTYSWEGPEAIHLTYRRISELDVLMLLYLALEAPIDGCPDALRLISFNTPMAVFNCVPAYGRMYGVCETEPEHYLKVLASRFGIRVELLKGEIRIQGISRQVINSFNCLLDRFVAERAENRVLKIACIFAACLIGFAWYVLR